MCVCVCCCVFDQLWFPENCVQCGWEWGKGDYTKKGIRVQGRKDERQWRETLIFTVAIFVNGKHLHVAFKNSGFLLFLYKVQLNSHSTTVLEFL